MNEDKILEIDWRHSGHFNHVLYAGLDNRFVFGTRTEQEFTNNRRRVQSMQAQVVMRSDRSGEEIWSSTSEDNRDEVQSIAVSPDHKLVAWCTFGTILIVDAERGRLVRGIGVATAE